MDKKTNDGDLILVFDFGGGTFDVTLLSITLSMDDSPNIEVKATVGVADLGGADVDEALKKLAITKYESATNSTFPSDDHEANFTLLRKVMIAKIALSMRNNLIRNGWRLVIYYSFD